MKQEGIFTISGISATAAATSCRTVRMIWKKCLTVLLLLSVTIAAYSQPEVFELDGLPGPVYYDASKALEEGDAGEIVVVMIHGWGGGLTPLKSRKKLEDALGGVYVISPRFPRLQTFDNKNLAVDDRPHWNESWSSDLAVKGDASDDWRGGGDADGFRMSSFDVIDRIFSKLADRKLYPNLKKVVLAGFSAGGQFVSRYVAVGRGKVRRGVRVEYAAMSGSTYLFFDPESPWHYGLDGRPRYCAGTSLRRIMSNLCSRRVFYACGELDTGSVSLDMCQQAQGQGLNRRERFENLQKHVHAYPRWEKMTSFYLIPGIAHEAGKAYLDPVFVDFIRSGSQPACQSRQLEP